MLLVFRPRPGQSNYNSGVVSFISLYLNIRSGGGADGSIATFNETELTFPANLGIDDVLDDLGPFILKHANTVSPGDL